MNLDEFILILNAKTKRGIVLSRNIYSCNIQMYSRSVEISFPRDIKVINKHLTGIVKFVFKGIVFFSMKFEDENNVIPFVDKWLNEEKDLSWFKQNCSNGTSIRFEPGVDLLSVDIRKYIEWKWLRLIKDSFSVINARGYRKLYDLLLGSDFSKYVPVFHGHMGLSVSNYFNLDQTKFPFIEKVNDDYFIHRINGTLKRDPRTYDISNILDAYRKYFPEELVWATYSSFYRPKKDK